MQQRETWIIVELCDNGIGFKTDEISDSRLGLQIVQSYVIEKLNGELTINSEPGKGTKFTIKFNRVDN